MAQRALQHVTPHTDSRGVSKGKENEAQARTVNRCRLVDLYLPASPSRIPSNKTSACTTPTPSQVARPSEAQASTRNETLSNLAMVMREQHRIKRFKVDSPAMENNSAKHKTIALSELQTLRIPESPCQASKARRSLSTTLMSYSKALPLSDFTNSKKRKHIPLSNLLPKPAQTPDRPDFRPLCHPPPPIVVEKPSVVDISPTRRHRKGTLNMEPESPLKNRVQAIINSEQTNWEMWRSDAQRRMNVKSTKSSLVQPFKSFNLIHNPKLEPCKGRSIMVEGQDEMGKSWTLVLSLNNSVVMGATSSSDAIGPVTTTMAELVRHYQPGATIKIYQPWFTIKESMLVCGRFGVESKCCDDIREVPFSCKATPREGIHDQPLIKSLLWRIKFHGTQGGQQTLHVLFVGTDVTAI
ncbi:uncharacterized protein MELLADRAFT_117733 [Melampsora larici-populina 98AG31]|uniref:Uncharacterized protein n=1 Tax=Melampsora larici-populina (strain 98AG31 / pathotype 3-4-7) TaxID=747676 RepID=F4S0Y5_MELLP|nr:uncharacterized protein MELLADRAFT_117733 [Melampsora larici-populina 98AG31]EGG01729.1 hypothetical protein MELLADRAFT_117733 [Melampsora larici-populina 98AG31]